MKGTLYLVAVHIGDPQDMTLRSLELLKTCQTVICEDLKEARRLLHEFNIQNDLLPLNEHTAREATEEALELLEQGKNLVLISDAGTPLLADPGAELVRLALERGYPVTSAPGASSILPALILSGFPTAPFTFVGFLPREKEERRRAAARYATRDETLILLEAPYRLRQVLDDLQGAFGPSREACVCMNLTMPSERVQRGTLLELVQHFAQHPFKGEFVIVIKPASAKFRQGHRRTVRS